MITRSNLLYSTFIGLKIEVIRSTVRNLIGISGIIVDETKNLIVIEKNTKNENKKEIRIPKISSVFRFTLDSGETINLDGSKICFRPHERPKKV